LMNRFKKLLLVFDSKERDRTALHLAFRLARDSGGTLTVVHAIPPLPLELLDGLAELGDLRRSLEDAAHASIREALEEAPDPQVPVETRLVWGHVDMEVSRLVLREGYDLVMKATGRRQQVSGQLIGSVDMRLLRKCPCPVWLVKPEAHVQLNRVLATVDCAGRDAEHEQLNGAILDLGVLLSEMESADLHVLYAWEPWGASLLRHRMRQHDFSEYLDHTRSRAGKALTDLLRPYDGVIPLVNRHFVERSPEDAVPEFVAHHDVDVVVMGTVGRTGVPGFFIGNTAERILREVKCSVLAVKPEGFKTPVEPE